MGKRRFDAKKIARQPNLKKRMAKFCAMVDVKYTPDLKINFEEILTNGHRGYISFSEEALAKEFDKRLMILRTKYSTMKASDDKSKKEDRWYRQSDQFVEVELYYEEGVSIANEVFEEQFFT